MGGDAATNRQAQAVAEAQFTRIANDGCCQHDYARALQADETSSATRNLADAVHMFCQIYGRHPGMVELALANTPAGPVRDWMMKAADAFERERLFLVRLTSAVGPLPSTPGAHETESVLQAQRRAVETLARSEREGCSLGAATALVGDWPTVRAVLERAANRAGIEVPACVLPGEADCAQIINAAVHGAAAQRALTFGTEQLLLQHRGLFDLLEARAVARDKADGIV